MGSGRNWNINYLVNSALLFIIKCVFGIRYMHCKNSGLIDLIPGYIVADLLCCLKDTLLLAMGRHLVSTCINVYDNSCACMNPGYALRI